MNLIEWAGLDHAAQAQTLARPRQARDANLRRSVAGIIAAVHADGDAALRRYAAEFDHVSLGPLRVDEDEFKAADAAVAPEVKRAIAEAAARIETFHRACRVPDAAADTAPGVRVERISRPIARVGLYVPAGSAPLPSTVLMLALPARLAGCREVVLCSPPTRSGGCDATVLHAARACGVHTVFKAGGAQAIAAMAYGTESIPRCDKLFGPGNAYVTEAKLQVASDPAGAAIDLPAGPSEVFVIADAGANPAFVAADLLSQAEHGPDSQVLLVSDSRELLDAAARAVEQQRAALPRAAIAGAALAHSRLIHADTLRTAFAIANRYAPEHLILHLREPRSWLDQVESAGSVFLGGWTPESLGDYCSGSNHVLPTYGWARSCSGVSVASFQKQITVQTCTPQGLQAIGPCAATLAATERLDAHRRAVEVRLAALADVPREAAASGSGA